MKSTEIIAMAANGNADAEAFLCSWVAHCRMMDDAFDRDRPVTDERMGEVFTGLMSELSGSQFYQVHKPMLFALMVVSINAWIDANKRSGAERAVLAGMYHEVVYLVAFIVGGWRHLRHVSSECREYKTPASIPANQGAK